MRIMVGAGWCYVWMSILPDHTVFFGSLKTYVTTNFGMISIHKHTMHRQQPEQQIHNTKQKGRKHKTIINTIGNILIIIMDHLYVQIMIYTGMHYLNRKIGRSINFLYQNNNVIGSTKKITLYV